MTLKKILPGVKLSPKLAGLPVKGISDDSRAVVPGSIFFIRQGQGFDVFSIIKKIEKKAAVLVGKAADKGRLLPLVKNKPLILVRDVNFCLRRAADIFYGFKVKDFVFIGITGTKGKSTTAQFVWEFLRDKGLPAGLIGTVEYRVNDDLVRAVHTTPDHLTLRRLLNRMKLSRARYVVMEVSSHAIKQQRIAGLRFGVCAFTNLSREHLDYHKTMKDYFLTKKRFFLDNPGAKAVINIDDAHGRALAAKSIKKITYSRKTDADIRGRLIAMDKAGLSFCLEAGPRAVLARTRLVGKHNLENILCAAGILIALGFNIRQIGRFIPRFSGAKGRLEKVARDVFVDYAHTHDSLRKTLAALQEVGYGKIICVFGCGGNRDHGKRPLMGKVAGRGAFYSVITSDNPRDEDPITICRQVSRGFERKNFSLVVDRRQAIKRGLQLKGRHAGSCLLVAGKGHEDYQIIKGKKLPFNDKKVIREIIKKTGL